ncbi:MAG: TRAP transporter large permease subunit [Rhodobiaceae bacterium]|nr:TRAP transporter large permease subunit [Rhodobiaceae bacterium]MCC0012874.1 TRAP transporter large permease subunit [Rhodobiaceae bacterium]MCC0019152.1 TRAP transporter large permease subunit [Rhodobiaceae bacterium]MCC0051054.1 TRAP transporter large permease subunit [Rhodobiaceae bacterium]MCC0060099.1 TRAP transporter large permease subunit [Rhodobiaceae bacterium]
MQTASFLPVLCLFATAFGAVLAGIPVAFALCGAALLCAFAGHLFGVFDVFLLGAIPSRIFGTAMFNEVLTAVPLFILMGVVLEKSRIAEDLLASMADTFARVPAGLGVSVTLVGTLVAASTGIVGATVVAMGLISLPVMLKRGYDPAFAAGSICAAGTLGQIIPPSIVLVFLGDQLSASYLQAQRQAGNVSPEPISIGDLFAGALVPGLMLAGLYVLYQIAAGTLRPAIAPPPAKNAAAPQTAKIITGLVAPLVLIVCVLGSIIAGIATPTEAAGVGAFGAVLLAARKQLAAAGSQATRAIDAGIACAALLPVLKSFADLRGSAAPDMAAFGLAVAATLALGIAGTVALATLHRRGMLFDIASSATRFSALAFTILIGATIFTLVFRGFGGDEAVGHLLDRVPGGALGAVIAVSLVIFALGFVLDFIEIVFIVLPVVGPAILKSDIDPVWFGVLIAMNLQTSFLTPPFGFALFYLRGVAPKEIRTAHIYRGVVPFIMIQLIGLLLVGLFPALATWLPQLLRG